MSLKMIYPWMQICGDYGYIYFCSDEYLMGIGILWLCLGNG